MTVLDGKALSDKVKEEVKVEVEKLQKDKQMTPGLAVILVGSDAASATYVGMKAKACKNAGIRITSYNVCYTKLLRNSCCIYLFW